MYVPNEPVAFRRKKQTERLGYGTCTIFNGAGSGILK
jgi:hypothetical protein